MLSVDMSMYSSGVWARRGLLGVCVGVERGTAVLSSAGGSLPFCLSGSSQLGLTRRRMRPKPFGAISCIPDGASPASTLAFTSLPRHCVGNASPRYNTQRTQGTPCLCLVACPSEPSLACQPANSLPITNTRSETSPTAYLTAHHTSSSPPPTPPRPSIVSPCTPPPPMTLLSLSVPPTASSL